jgi:hypothetical protein
VENKRWWDFMHPRGRRGGVFIGVEVGVKSRES